MKPITGELDLKCMRCGTGKPQRVKVTGYELPKPGQRGGVRVSFVCPAGHNGSIFIGKADVAKLGIKTGGCGCPYVGKGEESKLPAESTSEPILGSGKSRSRGSRKAQHTKKSRSKGSRKHKSRSKSRSKGHKK